MSSRSPYVYAVRRRKKLACTLFALIIALEEREAIRAPRSSWVSPYIARRDERGMHHNLFLELALEDPNRFRRCLRMDTESFEYLLGKVAPFIIKSDTHLRKSISPAERLSLTLRHIATGESQESLRLSFRMGQSTISGIVKEVCSAICKVLKDEYVRMPQSEEEWKVAANDYGERWNFHHCVGAMDGKHFGIDPPLSSGSLYFNYKGFCSVVLLAMVDAQLRFMYVDLGTNGRISDGGIWNKSTFKLAIDQNKLNLPPPQSLPGSENIFPFVIVGDEGFPLTTSVLIPYPGEQCRNRKDRRIFNYRLSRARRCSENAFGVLGARFQIFRAAMRYDPDDAVTIIMSTICLHNWLRSQAVGRAMYTPAAFIDVEDELVGEVREGEWRIADANGIVNLCRQGGNRHANDALQLREAWCEYFNGVRAVPWQDRMVR